MNQKITCPHCMKTFEVATEIFNTTVACPNCNGSFNPMNEFCKSAWKLTKIQEFQEFQDALNERIDEANQNITHADFVTGMQKKTIGFKVMVGEPYQILTGARKTTVEILALFDLVVLFILIPILAYIEHNWWLLIGIIVSLIATRMAARKLFSEKPNRKRRFYWLYLYIMLDFFRNSQLLYILLSVCIMGFHVFLHSRKCSA